MRDLPMLPRLEIYHLQLHLTEGSSQLVKLFKQENCNLQQSFFHLNAQTSISWQLPLHDMTLIVSEGFGIICSRDERIELKPGLFVWIPSYTPFRVEAEDDLSLLTTTIAAPDHQIQTDFCFHSGFLSTVACSN
jgi:mannose-6-phosphate isomerase-like protein (cupin superfamily)